MLSVSLRCFEAPPALIPSQSVVIDVERRDFAIVDVGVKERAVGETDLRANRAFSPRRAEIHVESVARLHAILDPVRAPLAVFPGAKFDGGDIRFVDDAEPPVGGRRGDRDRKRAADQRRK